MGIVVIIFWLYFLIYILIGFYQPIDAICRLLNSRKLNNDYTKGLKKYLLAVIAYFVVLMGLYMIDSFHKIEGFVLFYLFFVPWIYIIWYKIHIKMWTEKQNNQPLKK